MTTDMVRLCDIATVIAGQSPPGHTYNEYGSGLPFFQGKADFGELYPVARKWCVAPRKIAEAGDILVSVRAPVGPTNVARERCCIGRGLAAVRADEAFVLRDFVHWNIKHRQSELIAKGQGSTFAAIKQKDLKSLPIHLPPLDEQRQIVSILNRVAKIERLQKQAQERLSEFIPALFIKMFGDPATNPMGWERATLGELSQVQGGLQVTRKRKVHPLETPYLRVANVLRNRLDLREVKSMRVNEKELTRIQLMRGDLLIVEGHGNPSEIGRVAIWDGSIFDCVHQNHLIRVRLDRSMMLPEFACSYLNSLPGRQHLIRSGKTTSGLNTITTSNVKSCMIFTPPIRLQTLFAHFVADAHRLTATATTGNHRTLALSTSLMSQLLGPAT